MNNFISSFRVRIRKNLFLRKVFGYYLPSSGLLDRYFRNYQLAPSWQQRLNDIMESKDNDYIPRVKNAGAIKNGKQTMHNGILINLGSYYGPEYSVVFQKSRGVHEPQEERVFGAVLKNLQSGSTMLELGSFWSFYSMWFNKVIPNARNFMIEPDSFNLGNGKRNFKLNNMHGKFIQAFLGASSSLDSGVPTLCIDDIVKLNQIDFIDILHSDIQGFEYEMLNGAKSCFDEKKIGYVFISTHSNEVHNQCLQYLRNYRFVIIANADLDHTFSEDGLIVARASEYPGIDSIDIDMKLSAK